MYKTEGFWREEEREREETEREVVNERKQGIMREMMIDQVLAEVYCNKSLAFMM